MKRGCLYAESSFLIGSGHGRLCLLFWPLGSGPIHMGLPRLLLCTEVTFATYHCEIISPSQDSWRRCRGWSMVKLKSIHIALFQKSTYLGPLKVQDFLSTWLTFQGFSVNPSGGSIWRKNNLGLFSHPGEELDKTTWYLLSHNSYYRSINQTSKEFLQTCPCRPHLGLQRSWVLLLVESCTMLVASYCLLRFPFYSRPENQYPWMTPSIGVDPGIRASLLDNRSVHIVSTSHSYGRSLHVTPFKFLKFPLKESPP